MNEETKKKAELAKQLRISYGTVFGSEHGKRILDDLKKRYGWAGEVERPSALPGARAEDVFLTEGMKIPIRHILAQLATRDDDPLPTKATSHE